jgi:hypothetical protein
MSKLVAIGAIGLYSLYVLGLQNPEESDSVDELVFDDDGQEVLVEDPLQNYLAMMGISMGTSLGIRAVVRGGSKAISTVTGRAATRAATATATRAATATATRAATATATKAATNATSKVVTTAATKAPTLVVTKAADAAADAARAAKAADAAADAVKAAKAADAAADAARAAKAADAATDAARAAKAADAAADAAKAAKASANAAKGAKASSMLSKLKGTPADLIMMIISQILITVLDLDPDKFAACDNGEFDLNGLPDWAKAMISGVPVLGDIFDLVGNKLCFRGGCEKGLDNEGGLCYKPCDPGFKSDGAIMCWKQYPEFENNGMGHTIVNITKKMITEVGSIPTDCPPGTENQGGICYPSCAPGYDGVLGRCWARIQKVNTVGRLPDKAGCPNGWRDDGTSCWDDLKTTGGGCRGGNTYECGRLRGAFGEDWGAKWCTNPIQCDPVVTTGSGTIKMTLFQRQSCAVDEDMVDGLCYKKCPAGMGRVPGAPYDCRTNGDISTDRGAGVLTGCGSGLVKDGALCYKEKPGYTLLAGTFAQNCPSGSKDIGVACERASYNRGVGLMPLGIRMKPRL